MPSPSLGPTVARPGRPSLVCMCVFLCVYVRVQLPLWVVGGGGRGKGRILSGPSSTSAIGRLRPPPSQALSYPGRHVRV